MYKTTLSASLTIQLIYVPFSDTVNKQNGKCIFKYTKFQAESALLVTAYPFYKNKIIWQCLEE